MYKPPKEEITVRQKPSEPKLRRATRLNSQKKPKRKARSISLTDEQIHTQQQRQQQINDLDRIDNEILVRTIEHLNTNPTGEPLNNPQQQALFLSSVDFIN